MFNIQKNFIRPFDRLLLQNQLTKNTKNKYKNIIEPGCDNMLAQQPHAPTIKRFIFMPIL